MALHSKSVDLPWPLLAGSLFELEATMRQHEGSEIIRFYVASADNEHCRCEYAVSDDQSQVGESVFSFRPRDRLLANDKFVVTMIVPTGVGAQIGGHAGDATPASQLIASCCDLLVTHPNVVNGSDINEARSNTLYVEGAALSRFMMGTRDLVPVRGNRLNVLLDASGDQFFLDQAVNMVNAAMATGGIEIDQIIVSDQLPRISIGTTAAGAATGRVDGVGPTKRLLQEICTDKSAVAIASIIQCPQELQREYFTGQLSVNPWGGVEAMLTHYLGERLGVPVAHAPMLTSGHVSDTGFYGVTDPRFAAEAVSLTFLFCVLKGLARSPRAVMPDTVANSLSAGNVSALVIPANCIGLPVLAALHHGMTTIVVAENATVVDAPIARLPWAKGQLWIVNNYWEAAGLLVCLREGINPAACRRPLFGSAILQHVGSHIVPFE